MQRKEMNDPQLRDWKYFNLILESYGWEDCEDTEARVDQGENCTPEGYRVYRGRFARLEARFHAPVNMVSLRIIETPDQDQIQLHFLYNSRPERILEWIASQQDGLSLTTYQDLLSGAESRCEMILLEKSDMEIYEVRPSTH